MGLFDRIMREARRTVTNAVFDSTIKPEIEKNVREGFGVNNNTECTLSEKYSSFPKYEGKAIEKPVEINTAKYDRVTMEFSGSPSAEFISSLGANGFVKATHVRYDRANTYVIVENNGGRTKIVYHIKK